MLYEKVQPCRILPKCFEDVSSLTDFPADSE